VYSGKAGGPIAELVKLVGEVVAVRRAPIAFDVVKGKGTFTVGDTVSAQLKPFLGPSSCCSWSPDISGLGRSAAWPSSPRPY
jgi:hypothetical protein